MALILVLIISYLATSTNVEAGSRRLAIVDTDPGIDDAVALAVVLGDPNVEVLAVTCVRGNTNVSQVVINALEILRLANKTHIPVYSGENFGLVEAPPSDFFFGEKGFRNLSLNNPPSPLDIKEEHAASFLAKIVKNHPGRISILALGPLTNIALALELNPNFLLQAKRIVIQGGFVRGGGDVAPGLSFNFHADPAAARVVLERALLTNTSVTLVPGDTIMKYDLTQDWRWNLIAKINNPVVKFLNELESRQQAAVNDPVYNPSDPFAAGVFLSPRIVNNSQDYYGFVESEGQKLRGASTLDLYNITGNPANLHVIQELSVSALKQLIFDSLSNFS